MIAQCHMIAFNLACRRQTPTGTAALEMGTQTPAKGVHWGLEDLSFGSDASSAILSTSSLDYINSQLVAHGFAPTPGLSLDGIANTDLDRVVKCLLGMLSQRVVSPICGRSAFKD